MKLQPNFSWQKYEGAAEDQKEQFQYQLQQQHIAVANALNATINDLSYYNKERQTSFSWLNGKPIFTQTFPTGTWIGGTTSTITFTTGMSPNGVTVLQMNGCISNGTTTLTLPNVGPAVANSIGVQATASVTGQITTVTVTLASGGTNYSAYSGSVTIYYIKN